ncbi:MAG: AAA family ATPase [Synergistaceae bacterium]|nr:AAA family ATPase [Synergistaceae bacterium]
MGNISRLEKELFNSEINSERSLMRSLPMDVNQVISGGPGTGKTKMAIERALILAKKQIDNGDNRKVLLLVYNRPLAMYISTQLSGKNFEVKTMHSWLSEQLNIPNIINNMPNMSEIIKTLRQYEKNKPYKHIIVDEAQDFDLDFFKGLMCMADNLTCFIDTNQISDNNNRHISNVHDLVGIIKAEDDFPLDENFRNTKEINDVAGLFNASAFELTTRSNGNKPIIHLCNNFTEQDDVIMNVINDNSDKSIGIIVDTYHNRHIATYHNLKVLIPTVEFYKYGKNYSQLDFFNLEPKILSYGTMKGLEFDIVLLTGFNMLSSCGDQQLDYNRVFVAISRAKEELHIFCVNSYVSTKYIDTMSVLKKHKALLTWE